MSASRKKAWETRRAKYGQHGHGGYMRSRRPISIAARAIEEIGLARRQCQILLPEKAAHIAITRIDNAIHLLEMGYER